MVSLNKSFWLICHKLACHTTEYILALDNPSVLGPGPVIRLYLDDVVGVNAPVTGYGNGGGLLPSSALSYCSSPDVVVSCLGSSGSESELSGAANLQ